MQTKFKVGDKVRVVRNVESGAKGWNNCWVPEMDGYIGRYFYIAEHDPDCNDYILKSEDFRSSYYFPAEALELAEEGLTISCSEEKSLREAIAIARGIDTLGRISQNAVDTLAGFVEAYLDNPTK